MKLIIFLIIIIALNACSSYVPVKETFIRDTVYSIVPKKIIDSAHANIWTDTLIRVIRENSVNDTIVDIQVQPTTHEVFWKIQPDTVRIPVRDTLIKTQIQTEIIETPFLSKIGLVFVGFFCTCLIGFLICNLIKNKKV